MTALMLATNKGHLDTVQALIDGGADIDAQHPVSPSCDIFRLTSHYLVCYRRQDGQPYSLLPRLATLKYSKNYCTKGRKQKWRFVY